MKTITPRKLTAVLAAHEKWLRGSGGACADLSFTNLNGARLDRARLDHASLIGAHLIGARLDRANLNGAHLIGARLDRANLNGAHLSGAHLSGATIAPGFVLAAFPLVARATRVVDPYEFFGWRTDKGLHIMAGCRFYTPSAYRAHVKKSYPGTPKAAETLRIISFIERAYSEVETGR